jgi:hypothetical protein
LKISKALYSDFNVERARALALADWRRDTNPHSVFSPKGRRASGVGAGGALSSRARKDLRYIDFRRSLFELADTW